MCINFSYNNNTICFAFKIYVGGINAVSGETIQEPVATKLRRANLKAKRESIQDYLVTPGQEWLDGIAIAPNQVRQFVALPTGAGASVESQITGSDYNAGIQFEITPRHYLRRVQTRRGGGCQIFVRTLRGPLSRQKFIS
jgi:hypothetical protein